METDYGEVPIDQIKVGDKVLAYNEQTKTTGDYTITAVHAHTDPVVTDLALDGETIHTTPQHPFETEERGWVNAGDLKVGEHIRKADGSYGVVQKVVLHQQPQTMYNLTIETAHTFFVGSGQWLVHNMCAGELKPARSFPHGFKTFEEFENFGQTLNTGVAEAGYENATAAFGGSSVTGFKYTTGAPFDVGRISDFDIAIISPEMVDDAAAIGVPLRGGGARTAPLPDWALKELGLDTMASNLSNVAEREVNFMPYRSLQDLLGRGQPIILVPK